jgi:hypothetical protein
MYHAYYAAAKELGADIFFQQILVLTGTQLRIQSPSCFI